MNNEKSIRKDWKLIESLVSNKSKVLDIGCGEGGLLALLEKNIEAKTNGIEVNPELARKAIANGYNVVQVGKVEDPALYERAKKFYTSLASK